jgi:hypothetical protein
VSHKHRERGAKNQKFSALRATRICESLQCAIDCWLKSPRRLFAAKNFKIKKHFDFRCLRGYCESIRRSRLTFIAITTNCATSRSTRALSRCDPESGASAVPAGGLANRSRAASGIMSAGITAGARGAAAGLGQASAGNARTLARPRKPGLKSKSRGLETTARAAVERREASAPEADDSDRPWRAPRPWRELVATSVRVVRPIRFAPSGAPPPFLFGGETSVAFVLAAKLGREARRENGIAFTLPCRGRGAHQRCAGWGRTIVK